MNSSRKSPAARLHILLPLLFFSALLLAVSLLPGEQSFQAPQQEYENDSIKKSTLIFSRPSGFYEDAFVLQISAPTKEIYYTLDGTEPVRGRDGTFRYDSTKDGGIEITDATARENIYSMRTDVTTGFDEQAVEELAGGDRLMHYRVPQYQVEKCTVLRAVYYTEDDKRSDIETGVYFIGFEDREGFGGLPVVSIVTDPASLFDHESGIYVTGKAFDDFAAADSFHDSSIWYRHVWWWWDANYHNRGRAWERPADIQFFGCDGTLLLQQQAGIRIQGGGSRGFLPKSLNLYARSEYGGNTSFHYDFFGTGYEAKRMTLTSSGDDYYTKCKDRLVSELAAGLSPAQSTAAASGLSPDLDTSSGQDPDSVSGQDPAAAPEPLSGQGTDSTARGAVSGLSSGQDFSTMHYRPCLLFLDGEFWGFYYLTEKYDEKYFSYYYGVPEEEVIEIKNGELESASAGSFEDDSADSTGTDASAAWKAAEAQDRADLALYEEMKAFIENNDMSVPENYEKACSLLDMDSFVNYYAVLIYCARCGDWPQGNFALWRTRTTLPAGSDINYHDGRWRWILFDVNSAAISPNLVEHDTLGYVLNNKSMKLFASLWKNDGFRDLFRDRILEYGQTLFSPETTNAALDAYVSSMEAPMAVHFRRFFGEDSGLNFPELVDGELRGFFEKRYEVIEKTVEDHMQQE